jgi:hypothetical protein
VTRKDLFAVTLAIVGFFSFVWADKALAHGPYSHWLTPGTAASCCNEKKTINGEMTGDCYPTVAELRPSADKAVTGVVWWAKRDTGEWTEIPGTSVLHELNPDETGQAAHLCYSDITNHVLCFVPPFGGG